MKHFLPLNGLLYVLLIIPFVVCTALSGNSSGDDMKKKEEIKYGWIGIEIRDVNKKIVEKEKLDSEEGIYVDKVVKESPAETGGVKEGDVILEIDGKKISDTDELVTLVRKTEPGKTLTLTVMHDGKKKSLSVKVGVGSHRQNIHVTVPESSWLPRGNMIGIRAITLSEQLGEYFGAPNNEGVLVEEVRKGGPAEKAGLKAGDVITRVAGKSINDIEDIRRALAKYEPGDKVEVEIIRKGSKKVLSVEVEERPDEQKYFFHGYPGTGFFNTPIDGMEFNIDLDSLKSEIGKIQKEKFIELRKNLDKLGEKREELMEQARRLRVGTGRPIIL